MSLRRRKQPDAVRQQLLAETAKVAAAQGLAAVTLDAVASKAGVSKGGLTHHFPSKQSLLNAMFEQLLTLFERQLEAAMAADPEPRGRFARAYLSATLAALAADEDPDAPDETAGRRALIMASMTDPALRGRWSAWWDDLARRHADEAERPQELIVRYAADGLWLAAFMQSRADPAERARVAALLIAMTQGENPR